jgi:hypothetical protein
MHEVELFFHFSERCHLRRVGPDSFQASNEAKHLRLRLDTRLSATLYRGSESPMYGWVSRTFDVKRPTFTLVGRFKVTGPTHFQTAITGF